MSRSSSDSESAAQSSNSGSIARTDFADNPFFVARERVYNNTYWPYRLPADQQESLRQDHQHHLFSTELPGLARGPVDDVLRPSDRIKRILDLGCGTGIWLAEMAELFPQADCVGVDIVALQHNHQRDNCTFSFVEIPAGLQVFADEAFDIVHIRQMLYSISEYQQMLNQAVRLLRRGGLLLVHEFCSTLEGDRIEALVPSVLTYMQLFTNALLNRGIDTNLFGSMTDAFVVAGLDPDQVDEYQYYWQFCSSLVPGQVTHTLDFIEATRLLVCEGGEIDDAGFSRLVNAIEYEIRDFPSEGVDGIMAKWGYWWVMK